ncbi:MAG TPA: hypothetical protein DCP26_06765, partial [Brevundimonas sp.]|nr:hypothetical protein [Brevundimonas sp.]
MAGLPRKDVHAEPLIGAVLLPRQEIARSQVGPVLTARDGEGGDIGARRRVDHHDVAGVAVVQSAIRSAEAAQIGVTRAIAFGRGQGFAVLVFVDAHKTAAAPSPPDRLGEQDIGEGAVGGRAVARSGLGAVVVVTQDHIDDPAHGVGAV